MAEQICGIIGKIIILTEGYIFYRMLACLMNPRKWIPCKVAAVIGFGTVVSVIIYPQDMVNITLMLALFVLMNWVAFDAAWLLRISVIMLFYPTVVVINYTMWQIIGHVVLLFFDEDSMGNMIFYTVSWILPLLFWYMYYRTIERRLKNISELMDKRSWLLLDIVCLASMAASFTLIYFSPEESYKIVPGMLACLVTNIGSVRLSFYMADSIFADLERKNLRMQQNYYEELENNQMQIRRFRHDMKNHFAVAGELLRKKDYTGAEDYFEKLAGHMETRNRQFCKNGIVNALLNMKYNMASEEGIDAFFHIDIDKMIGLDEISLCTILANTLDNAIEALRKVEDIQERRLSVKARHTENGYFSYEIVNSKINEVQERKGLFLTDKEDKKSHGLGIPSVREVVEKYKGTLDISYTEEEFQVVVLIEV